MESISEYLITTITKVPENKGLSLIENVIEYFCCKANYFLECKYFMEVLRIISETFRNVMDADLNKKIVVLYKNIIKCKTETVIQVLPSILSLILLKTKSTWQICANVAEILSLVMKEDGYKTIASVINELPLNEEQKQKFLRELQNRKNKQNLILITIRDLRKTLN